MSTAAAQDSETKPLCNIPLCGREADWQVEMFGKVEYYCERHRPGVPEKFMNRLKNQSS
ncbi:MAG: hypothetical protein ABSF00_04470 [Candidatus Bathyarchaeia archaeon]